MTRAWGPVLLTVFVLLFSFHASNAAAQAGDSSSDGEARTRFEEGRAAYDAGRFDDAARAFQRAYLLSPRYALLFNIGQSQLRAGHDAQALAAFEAFLRQAPDTDTHHAEVTERVHILRSMGVTADAATAATTTASETTTTTTPTETTTTTTTTAVTPEPTPEPTPVPAPAEDSGGPGIAPWIVVGGGGALLVTGIILMAIGASDASSVTGAADGAMWSSLMGAANDANVLWGVGLGLGIAGLAAIGGGLAWALVGGSSPRSDQHASVGPSLGLRFTGTGLRLEGAF